MLSKHPIVVAHPKDLTVAWAQQVINKHSDDAEVKKVDIVSVEHGTTTRIRLKVNHNETEHISQRWFVKIPSLAWRTKVITALPRLLNTEIRFYEEIAKSIPINKPVFLAGGSQFGRGSTLVLADITESGGTPGYPGDTLTVIQAHKVIEQIVKVQAHFWNKAHTHSDYQWLAGSTRCLEDHLGTALAVPLMKRGLHLAGSLVPKHLHAPAIRYASRRRQVMRFLSGGPQTIVHHDCHPGNIFWDNSCPGLLDWQLIRIGEGVSDIAYFLSTALSPELQRLHGKDLLGYYFQSLVNNGVAGIDKATIQQRFRAHLVYPFEAMILTLALGGMMDLHDNHKLIQRTAQAIEDFDTFAALPI
jgi:hypothetical protein